jgi:putative DNA primase/helicase
MSRFADRPKAADLARGKWRDLLPKLGVEARYLDGKHGPCPLCGGKDRFRFTDVTQNGDYYCSQCDPGRGFDLVMKLHGWTYARAAQEVERLVGDCRVNPPVSMRTAPTRTQAMIRETWAKGRALGEVEGVRRWWERRAGFVPDCADLRAVPLLVTHDRKDAHPAMLALVRDPAGEVVQLHRTWVTETGEKAPIMAQRAVMPGDHPDASCVRLRAWDSVIGIAEGIETAATATAMFGVPCWAALNAGRLVTWAPPVEARQVVVFGDNDASFAGQRAAYALAERLRREGRAVEVKIPQAAGTDWNDEWMASLGP